MFRRSQRRHPFKTYIAEPLVNALAPWWGIDWWLMTVTVGLTVLAGLAIRSAQLNIGSTDWWQHWVTGGVGLGVCLAIARSRYQTMIVGHWLVYGLSILSLIAVLFIGVSANGAQSWINVAGFHVQPSEFAKVSLILSLAATLHQDTAARLPMLLKVFMIAAIPGSLILLQDLGTSLVFGAITLGMLYWANANFGWILLIISPIVSAILFGVAFPVWLIWFGLMGLTAWLTLPWRWLGTVGAMAGNAIAGVGAGILWNMLQPYQKDRLTLFLNPEQDALGGGYHLIQSRIAIGSGQLWGTGLYHGSQTQLNYVPEQHTDFIFSVVGEELGFMGAIAVMFLFWLLCLRLIRIACKTEDNFGSLIAVGVLSMVLFQVLINVGMTIGIAPITGIPLPWLSYGRSSLLTNFIAIGLVQSVANRTP
ncbi:MULTISPECIES: rod shape-determining protein RodA [unclassified Picosynechococcus]|uniref:rod shape-determining protein RodA n=2 Tax=unclassified Picosynechococcus TaxID=3079910 RepID=UPI00074585BF|nr:rod shape-determining protein RodA [Picosynechococcus sp. PCC 73109]ANV87953.1 rod shape-determining protein RodA [Picosynechococcus sp. PCC 7117]ANV91146.1 rod shape-determining protein RodA [Picosynechococcus sp. PCC 8807]